MASSPLQISSEKDFAGISNKHMDKVMGHMEVYHQSQGATLTAQGFLKSWSESHVFSTVTFLEHQLRLKNKKAAFNSKLFRSQYMTQAPGKNQFDRFLEGPDLGKKEKEKGWKERREYTHTQPLFFPQRCTSIFHDPCRLLILSSLCVIAELTFFCGFLLLVSSQTRAQWTLLSGLTHWVKLFELLSYFWVFVDV